MEIIANRIRALRESVKLSQVKIGEMIGLTQSSINRYETNLSSPPDKVLLWYADYFDVSLDYIYGRTDKPQGKLYNYEPQIIREKTQNNEQLKEFIEMCFDPNSSMNDKLKQTLFEMLSNTNKGGGE